MDSMENNMVDEIAQEIIQLMRKNKKWLDPEFKKQYFRNYHQQSELITCNLCKKDYKKSFGKKHFLSKRHIEFQNKTQNTLTI